MDFSWLNEILTPAADAYVKVKSADALASQQRASDGTIYTMGQFNQSGQSNVFPMLLLLGGAALLVVLVKD